MKFPIFPAVFAVVPLLHAADPPAKIFQLHCAACHAVDQMVVGPSLVEIAGIHRDDVDTFVKWCVTPERNRDGVIEMPSMAHLGEPVLRELHAYILEAAAGKTEQKKGKGDPYAVPPAFARRPQVQRIFLPDASPAAIAVALPGDLSFCFDAGECRLRYVWKGGFINGTPYWKGNGSSLAEIAGEVVYREARPPFSPLQAPGSAAPPEFLGYRIGKDGIPSFRYRLSGHEITETIRPLPDGGGIERQFETSGAALKLNDPEGASVLSSTGKAVIDGKSFTLTYRWK